MENKERRCEDCLDYRLLWTPRGYSMGCYVGSVPEYDGEGCSWFRRRDVHDCTNCVHCDVYFNGYGVEVHECLLDGEVLECWNDVCDEWTDEEGGEDD